MTSFTVQILLISSFITAFLGVYMFQLFIKRNKNYTVSKNPIVIVILFILVFGLSAATIFGLLYFNDFKF